MFLSLVRKNVQFLKDKTNIFDVIKIKIFFNDTLLKG